MSAQVISFKCLLKSKTGQVISSSYNRDVVTAGEPGTDHLEGLVKGLQNLKKGEKRKISLTAEEAYGFYDPTKVILYPKKKLTKDVQVGQFVAITGKSGNIRNYKVTQFYNDMVLLDGNHPLAGQDLVFEIETMAVREATADDLAGSGEVVSQTLLH